MSLVNNFNGKNVQYFIVDGTKISDEEKIEEILNNENTRIQLPRNCILFTEVKNNYQMYLIDDLGCSKRVEFPLDKVYKDIRSTVSYAYNNLMVNVTYAYNNAIEKVIKVAEDTELSIQILAYNFSYELLNHIEQINRNKENIAANVTGISTNTENILYLSQLVNNKADKTELDNYYTKTKSHEIFAEINHTHDEYLTQHQSLEDYATKSYISNNYQIKGNYVKMVTVNGTGIEPDANGNVDLGELQTQLGLTGIQGIQGATGIAGINGKQGVTGVAGKQGITGINGLQGATGINGKQGITGINGIKGATGAKGLTPNIGIGSCITVNSDVQASVWITTGPNANDINLNFNIPKGEKGAPGSSGSGNTTIVSNEWEDIQGKPSWHSVAFSGDYNDLNNIPNLDGYATIEQLTNALLFKISSDNINKINRDKVNNENVLKIFWGEDNGYNFTLYPNVQANWNQTDDSKPDFIIGKPDSAKFTNVWMKGAKLISGGFEYYNKDSIQRVVYSLKNNGEEDYESKVNKRDGTPMFIQNDVSGYHSVGMGWANIINGDHSVSEGKLVTVNGDFSHGMGYYTNINGNYSFAGGLDDGNIFTHNDYPTNNYAINGNYSFGIGKNIRTYNHGEIAFGKYNESRHINKNTNQDIEKISLPRFNEIVYDSLGNPWKIIDFYNIDTVDNFDPDNVDQFVQRQMSADGYQSNYNDKPLYYCYNYRYNPTDIHLKIDGQKYTFKVNEYYGINTEDGPDFNTGGNAVDDRDDKYLYYIFKPNHPEIIYDIELVDDDGSYEDSYYEHSNNFSEFIYKIFDKKCNYIINNYVKYGKDNNDFYNINDFCECILYNINYYRTNYEYIYNIPYYEGSPQGIAYTTDPIIIGVIAQKIGEDNLETNEFEFFIWGPNSLYYNNELFTMFSIGNGNQYKRNNLFEITNDGNVYYDNGKKDLFSLDNKINDIEENLDININITNYDNTYINNNDIIINTYQNNNDFITSLYEYSDGGQSTIIPINHNSPKQLFIDDEQYLQIDKSYLSTVKDYDVQDSWRDNRNSGLYKYQNDDYAYYYLNGSEHYLVKIINKDIHFYINETENYSFRKNIIIENKFDFGTAVDNPYFDVSGGSSDYPYFVFHADNNIKIYFEYNLYDKYPNCFDIGTVNDNTKYLQLFNEDINLINIEINVLNKICLVNITVY